MPKLRNSIITQILDYLEYGDFCVEDFDAQFPDDSNILAQITFKALPKYSFVLDETYPGGAIASSLAITRQGNSKRVIRTIEKPGEYKNHEQKTHDSIDSAIRRVSDWVVSIRDDLIHSRATLRSTIDELTENFQKSIDENINDPESYFEESEEGDIKRKLDELQARVSELESKLDISPEDTKKIQRVIDKSKSDLKVYPKGVWYKTVGTKLLKVMKEVLKTKEGRELLTDMAKKLLQ
jgi:hemoglobin-like flavoprotein